jgi:hypothetical protein
MANGELPSRASEAAGQADGHSLFMFLIPEGAAARIKALLKARPGDGNPDFDAGEDVFITEEEIEEPSEALQPTHELSPASQS